MRTPVQVASGPEREQFEVQLTTLATYAAHPRSLHGQRLSAARETDRPPLSLALAAAGRERGAVGG